MESIMDNIVNVPSLNSGRNDAPNVEPSQSANAVAASAAPSTSDRSRSATIDGAATVTIGDHEIEIRSSAFLDTARGVMLARYVEARSPELDAVLDAAGVLPYFADHTDQATSVPDPTGPARPADNRPYRIEN